MRHSWGRSNERPKVHVSSSAGRGQLQTEDLEILASASHKDRDAAILQFRLRGVTLQEIASQAGLSRERVRQICLREGKALGTDTSMPAIRTRIDSTSRATVEAESRRLRRAWSAAILNRPGVTVAELMNSTPPIGDVVATPSRIVSECIARFMRRTPRGGVDDASESELRSSLIRALQVAATYEVPLSRRTFNQLVNLREVHSPTSQSVGLVFGSWSNACAAAEIECNTPVRSVYDRQWSRREIVEVLMEFILDHRAKSTFDGYSNWRNQDFIPAAPSPALVRQRMGSWSNVMNQVLDAIAEDEAAYAKVQEFQQCVDWHREWR